MIQFHEKAVLQFSGGRDSLACLHLLKPDWEKIMVVWVNTGSAYPETIEQMEQVKKMVPNFMEMRSDQTGFIQEHGYPVDVLPVSNTRFAKTVRDSDGIKLQPWVTCCMSNLWIPLQKACQETGATLVIRGQKKSDYMKVPAKSGQTENGLTLWMPLENWTDDEVTNYLTNMNIPIPDYYEWSDTSLDCWNCTAFLGERAKELNFLKDKHPEFWSVLQPRLIEIRDITEREMLPLRLLT